MLPDLPVPRASASRHLRHSRAERGLQPRGYCRSDESSGRPAGLAKGTLLPLDTLAVLEAASFSFLLGGSAVSAVFFVAGFAVAYGFRCALRGDVPSTTRSA